VLFRSLRHASKRLLPRQDQRLQRPAALLRLERATDKVGKVERVTGFVTCLRREPARQDEIVAVALDLLLRIGQMSARGEQRAWSVSLHPRLLGLRDQRAR